MATSAVTATAYANFARKSAARTARISKLEAKKASAPASALKIPTRGLELGSAGAAIRQVGCTRRVFLRAPFLTGEELEGLAYRIKVLSKNKGINSILIASNDQEDNPLVLPDSCLDAERHQLDLADFGFSPIQIARVAGGYNPLEVYTSGTCHDRSALSSLLTSLEQLAVATRGDYSETRIPVITMPHGHVHDGGYALCMGSYVLATRDSSFSITNPSKGLSLDPIGLSYMLPRLGWEHRLPCADYTGVGTILALTGIKANASDMMETGLATNYVESHTVLGALERALADIVPWNQQGIVKDKPRMQGEEPPMGDANSQFRNRAVANTLHAFTIYHASNREMWTDSSRKFQGFEQLEGKDPSLVVDTVPWEAERESDLVNYAATFEDILERPSSLASLMESLREVASRRTNNEEELEGIKVAADLVKRMEAQCPLSLCVVFRLLELGANRGETLESCISREKNAQLKLFGMKDFQGWAKHAASGKEDVPFSGWSHGGVEDVSTDQVEELLAD